MMAQGYMGDIDRRTVFWGQPQAKSEILHEKWLKQKKGEVFEGMAQVVVNLPSKHEALISYLNTLYPKKVPTSDIDMLYAFRHILYSDFSSVKIV
jgi:hypothetical protein